MVKKSITLVESRAILGEIQVGIDGIASFHTDVLLAMLLVELDRQLGQSKNLAALKPRVLPAAA